MGLKEIIEEIKHCWNFSKIVETNSNPSEQDLIERHPELEGDEIALQTCGDMFLMPCEGGTKYDWEMVANYVEQRYYDGADDPQ